MSNTQQQLVSLSGYFAEKPPMAIALSGGVDSMTLAIVAHRANANTQMFHAISPAVPVQATARVKQYAELEGWHLHIINAGEMFDEAYIANPANRCYFCKTNLYDTVTHATDLQVASGTNLDDLGDYRPGLIAAEEHQVCHPYVDLQIDKASLRLIAGALDFTDLQDLPSAPCLSSRVTTGIAIDAALLPVINEVEQALSTMLAGHLSLQGVRCRIRPGSVALQIESPEPLDLQATFFLDSIAFVAALLRAKGFAQYADDIVIEPYQKGSAFLIETLALS